MTDSRLHPRLEADSIFLRDLAFSRSCGCNNIKSVPWLVPRPRAAPISREIYQLAETADRAQLIEEIAQADRGRSTCFMRSG